MVASFSPDLPFEDIISLNAKHTASFNLLCLSSNQYGINSFKIAALLKDNLEMELQRKRTVRLKP